LCCPACACSLRLLADSSWWYVLFANSQVLVVHLQHPKVGEDDLVLKVVPDERGSGYKQVSTSTAAGMQRDTQGVAATGLIQGSKDSIAIMKSIVRLVAVEGSGSFWLLLELTLLTCMQDARC
jgi:hypothetical protein